MKPRQSEYKLSATKSAFLQDPSINEVYPYLLKAEDLDVLIEHYQKKHNIRLIKNGQTLEFRRKLQKKRQLILERHRKYTDHHSSLAVYLTEHWLLPEHVKDNEFFISNMDSSAFHSFYNEIKALLKEFITAEGQIKPNLSPEELREINQLLHQNEQLRELLQNKIISFRRYLCKLFRNCCIDKSDMLLEVKSIQSTLKPEEVVGYIFTNGVQSSACHFEVLLISADKIIKPIGWKVSWTLAINPFDLPGLYTLILETPLFAQSGKRECGTLGLLYLKELLKENAKQLKEYSLSFSYYDRDQLSYFFFPSPHVLRYSQSNVYNNYVVALLDNADLTTITHKEKDVRFTTLKFLLLASMFFARQREDYVVLEDNRSILNRLQSFRQAWLKEYEKINEKRSLMYKGEQNVYLMYRTLKMEKLAVKKSPERNIFARAKKILYKRAARVSKRRAE